MSPKWDTKMARKALSVYIKLLLIIYQFDRQRRWRPSQPLSVYRPIHQLKFITKHNMYTYIYMYLGTYIFIYVKYMDG